MGCNGSKDDSIGAGTANDAPAAYDRRRKVSIRHGDWPPKVEEGANRPNIIFIFGGPGSKKGRILDDILTTYKFCYINGEKTLRNEIIKRVKAATEIKTIKDLKTLVDEDPDHVSLKNILRAIELKMDAEIRDNGTKLFVVDVLPNLRYLLKNNRLSTDCQQEFEHFEKKYPISFALNLAIPPERIITNDRRLSCTTPDGKPPEKKGDEADSARTQKRIDAYVNNSKNYLNYFDASGRMLTIDVNSGDSDLIWNCCRRILNQLEYHPYRTVNTVFMFAFSDEEVEAVDCVKFDMQIVRLKDILSDPMASLEATIETLSRHINNRCEGTESFVINAQGTSLEPAVISKGANNRSLLYKETTETEIGALELLLPGAPKDYVPTGVPLYKIVRSPENEICLFPESMDDKPIVEIVRYMTQSRTI